MDAGQPHDSAARRWVLLDELRAMELAVDHLVGLGHRHIGHLAGPIDADTAQRRRVRYESALVRRGLHPGPIVHAEYTIEGGTRAMHDLLAVADRPTAIVAATIASAAGALIEAQAAGVRVPEDLSVIAVHDIALAQCFAPPLTTVRMPLEELGRRAVELVTATALGEEVQETVTGTIEVVVRQSTCPPAEPPRQR